MINGIVRPPRAKYNTAQLGKICLICRKQAYQLQGPHLHAGRLQRGPQGQEYRAHCLQVYRRETTRHPLYHPLHARQLFLSSGSAWVTQKHARWHLSRLLRFHGLRQKRRVIDYQFGLSLGRSSQNYLRKTKKSWLPGYLMGSQYGCSHSFALRSNGIHRSRLLVQII